MTCLYFRAPVIIPRNKLAASRRRRLSRRQTCDGKISWQRQHVRLFTDTSVIEHHVINQPTELANNMTYMREAEPSGAS